jgi:diaminopimelate epimerase
LQIPFKKIHGAGNDFVLIEDLDDGVELTGEQVARICDRHKGVGADGVILVKPPKRDGAAAYMHYINSDGSLAQMCGNGVRCFAKFIVDGNLIKLKKLNNTCELVADTLSGLRPLVCELDNDGKLIQCTVDMGEPIFPAKEIPTTIAQNDAGIVAAAKVGTPYGDFELNCVSMGNPHAIAFLDIAAEELALMDIDRPGAFLECSDVFPEKCNIEFAVVDSNGIHMRVFERGCGETLACGTGACATAVMASVTNRAKRESNILLRGGTLHIRWAENNHVFMTGPAQLAFTGILDGNLLCLPGK